MKKTPTIGATVEVAEEASGLDASANSGVLKVAVNIILTGKSGNVRQVGQTQEIWLVCDKNGEVVTCEPSREQALEKYGKEQSHVKQQRE